MQNSCSLHCMQQIACRHSRRAPERFQTAAISPDKTSSQSPHATAVEAGGQTTRMTDQIRCCLQNAIVDNISGVYLRHANVLYSRILVVLLNVPCIVCSLRVSPSLPARKVQPATASVLCTELLP